MDGARWHAGSPGGSAHIQAGMGCRAHLGAPIAEDRGLSTAKWVPGLKMTASRARKKNQGIMQSTRSASTAM